MRWVRFYSTSSDIDSAPAIILFSKCDNEKDTGEEGGAVALGMANVEGIFYLLVMGVTLAIIIAIFDVLLETRARSKELEVRWLGVAWHMMLCSLFIDAAYA